MSQDFLEVGPIPGVCISSGPPTTTSRRTLMQEICGLTLRNPDLPEPSAFLPSPSAPSRMLGQGSPVSLRGGEFLSATGPSHPLRSTQCLWNPSRGTAVVRGQAGRWAASPTEEFASLTSGQPGSPGLLNHFSASMSGKTQRGLRPLGAQERGKP